MAWGEKKNVEGEGDDAVKVKQRLALWPEVCSTTREALRALRSAPTSLSSRLILYILHPAMIADAAKA